MDGVSDAAFRFITKKHGNPDVVITEFISVDGIVHAAGRLFTDFLYHPLERPVVAQVFGNDPELFYLAAQIVCELGFDGLDINMGCPAKSVSGRGAGAALIRTPEIAKEIVKAAQQGVADWVRAGLGSDRPKLLLIIANTKLKLTELGNKLPDFSDATQRAPIPVSVKTRIGFDSVVIEDWITHLLDVRPANISVHGRTLKQLYGGASDWKAIGRGAQLVAEYNQTAAEQITYLGNGDVSNYAQLQQILASTKVDGVLVGRASFGNPRIFAELRGAAPSLEANHILIDLALEHARLHVEIKGEGSYVQMRKHLGWYFRGFPGASALRVALMQTQSVQDLEQLFDKYRSSI